MADRLADAAARRAALDPERSFIVQAPAGSGKTGLLTQRYLVLLARVNHPEEVVAVTFTRKAAAEMRDRILEALQAAGMGEGASGDDHARLTGSLARAVLQRDRRFSWRLLENPGRLRILTIDALCATIARQMPVVSGLGGMPAMSETPAALYRAAARNTLATLERRDRWSESVAVLLDHLDNNGARAEEMLAHLLARREQWLRHVGRPDDPALRQLLEETLTAAVTTGLNAVATVIPDSLQTEILAVAGYAAAHLPDNGKNTPLIHWLQPQQFPGAGRETVPLWRGLRELLLTGNGDWRKRLDKNIGFPAAGRGMSAAEKAAAKAMKERAAALIGTLADIPGCREALVAVELLPEPVYDDGQWRILAALMHLLPMAVAQLLVIFRQQGVADFAEMARAAEEALGEPEAPTDLALRLDYRLQHLLVDEFQDTSQGQYRLLQRLTAGWSGEDGRTLFLVGDPMQSIYRFREAEVGLFLQAQRHGIGMVPLEPLLLTVNFRSQRGMVDWVNTVFADVLAAREDAAEGAVPFAASTPFHPRVPGAAVTVHPQVGNEADREAETVVRLAVEARNRGDSVAILGRTRAHLAAVIERLLRQRVRFQGVEIETLAGRTIIQDLLALTRALIHPADRIAWLAVLRAPWCGVTLQDLHRLAPAETTATVWECLREEKRWQRLSPDGRDRLRRVLVVLSWSLEGRHRLGVFPGSIGLRVRVEMTWERLGGPAVVSGARDLDDANRFFDLLEASEVGGELPDFTLFRERVDELFAGVDPEGDADLSLMTIHKAKGLEFDTVIIPGLGRRARGDDTPLLAWMERPDGLLLAPVKRSDEAAADPIHRYVRSLEKKRAGHETGRLLYVAVTRARRHLHLLGHVKEGTDPPGPESGSLLDRLWPGLTIDFDALPPAGTGTEPVPAGEGGRGLRRLAGGWILPEPPPGIRAESVPAVIEEEDPVPFDWAGETARYVGTVAHRLLRVMATEGVDRWPVERVNGHLPVIRTHLLRLGVPDDRLPEAVRQVADTLLAVLDDPRGRWILDPRHRGARAEYALSGLIQGYPVRMVLDRTFIDAEGVRWIIDFKTSMHGGGDVDGFLDNERSRYQGRMNRYGLLMRGLEDRPIRLGLYFPRLRGWREWALE